LNQRHLLTRQLVRKPVAPWAIQHLFLSTIAGKSMKAFGIKVKGGGVDALEELQLPQPELRSHDILIRVESCALNPIDTKLRKLTPPPGGFPKVLGFDGAGTVVTCGSEARSFEAGDKVFFAGSHIRNGSNAEFVAVDERIVGRMPKTINAATASSVPLCALTAWEGLEQLGINPLSASNKKQCLLMLPGAGGVGCYGIQFAKLAGLQVVATASRPESEAACRHLGADHVVNHKLPLKPQLDALAVVVERPVRGYPNWVELTIVMVIAPGVINVAFFYIVDNLIMRRGHGLRFHRHEDLLALEPLPRLSALQENEMSRAFLDADAMRSVQEPRRRSWA